MRHGEQGWGLCPDVGEGLQPLAQNHRRGLEGQEVSLAGWVHRRRDHGALIFVDLRDNDGIVQVVFNPKQAQEAYATADQVRSEYVIQVKGKVVRRRPGTENRDLPTGEGEVQAAAATILNAAKTPPFYIK